MKTLTLVLLALLTFCCQKITLQDEYSVKEGENNFTPRKMIELNRDKTLEEWFMFGEEWLEYPLTDPVGFGLKLSALGEFDYHDGGMNFQATCSGCKMIIKARYYVNGELTVIPGSKTYVNVNEPIYTRMCAYQDTAYWYINSKEVAKVAIHITPNYRTPPFLGSSGSDKWAITGKKAVAARELRLLNHRVR